MKATTCLLCLALLVGACAKRQTESITVDATDTEMNAAKQQARDSFHRFKARWNAKSNDKFTLVKVFFLDPAIKDGGEHMWVTPTSLDTDPMKGILMDQPDWLKTVKHGDAVTFKLADISDWVYVESNKAIGAYTVRLLRQRMTPPQRAQHDGHYPFQFD